MSQSTIDIVIPVFNEIEIIDQLHQRVSAACQETDLNFRIIYVDDGSTDSTAQWIADNAIDHNEASNGSTQLLRLSRNFGQPAAIFAGLESSTADCVVLMDGDLQDPPELIPDMVARWQSGDQIVIAQRSSRKETLIRGIGFRLFHRFFRYLSDSDIPPNTGTFCLMNRQAVDAVCKLPESHRFFPGLRAWVGFQQSMLPFERPDRAGGTPKQTLSRLTRYAMDAIFGYSLKPLRLLTATGGVICLTAFVLASWFIFKRLIGWESASLGFTTISCAVFGLGGFQLIAIGLLGEYIGRIYDEVKQRPPYLVGQKLETSNTMKQQVYHATRKAG